MTDKTTRQRQRQRPQEPNWETIARKAACSLPSMLHHEEMAVRDMDSLLSEAYKLVMRDAVRWEIYHDVES